MRPSIKGVDWIPGVCGRVLSCAMRVDPAIARLHAENVGAEILGLPPAPLLSASIIEKIAVGVKVFNGMSHDCLLATLTIGEHQSFKAGEVIFNEGDIGTCFHILIAGEVVVEKAKNDQTVILARMKRGDCFGEMALVGQHLRSATVRALRDTASMRFDRDRFDAYPASAHIIYRNIARILAQRLDESSEILTDLLLRSR